MKLIDFVHISVNLANNVEILLHDHFSGCTEIANPSGLNLFIPRGFAPWDEKLLSLGIGNFNVLVIHSVEITEIYSHTFSAKILCNQHLYFDPILFIQKEF